MTNSKGQTTIQKIASWFNNATSNEIQDGCNAEIETAKISIDGIELEADEFNLFFQNGNQIICDDNSTDGFIKGEHIEGLSLLELIEKCV